MTDPKQPPARPVTLGNMRELGAQHLIGWCLNDVRDQALIDGADFPDNVETCSRRSIRIGYLAK
jgi:hypothetical protein